MQEFIEYVFILPNGQKRYEMVDRCEVVKQVEAFRKLHGATIARPLLKLGAGNE